MKLAFIHWNVFKDHTAEKPELTDEHYARLAKGLELYKAGLVSKLVVTGNYQFGKRQHGSPAHEISAKWLMDKGVAESDILRVPHARLTMEEIAGARTIIETLKPKEIHIVTSDYHLPRCLSAFKAAYPNNKFVGHSVPMRDTVESVQHVARDTRLMRNFERAKRRRR